MTSFFFVRHGESEAQVDGRVTGRLPGVALTERGRAQVEALADELRHTRVDLLCSSPVQRARDTAAVLSAALGLEVEVAEALDELDMGRWSGMGLAQLDRAWQRSRDQRILLRPPGGESLAEVQARMLGVMEELSRRLPEGRVVLVGHADPIRAALAAAAGVPLDLAERIRVDNATVSIVEVEGERVWLRCLNRLTQLG